MSDEHMDVNVTQRQTLSLPLILQSLVMLGGLAAVYANGVANDREIATKYEAQQSQISQLQADSRTFKNDLRTDLREIKDEVRELRNSLMDRRK